MDSGLRAMVAMSWVCADGAEMRVLCEVVSKKWSTAGLEEGGEERGGREGEWRNDSRLGSLDQLRRPNQQPARQLVISTRPVTSVGVTGPVTLRAIAFLSATAYVLSLYRILCPYKHRVKYVL